IEMEMGKSILVCLFFSFCCSSYASFKEISQERECPYILPAQKNLLAVWGLLGDISTKQLQLRNIGVTTGNATEIKELLSARKDRVFAEDMIEDWDDVEGESPALGEYDEDFGEASLLCTYSREASQDS